MWILREICKARSDTFERCRSLAREFHGKLISSNNNRNITVLRRQLAVNHRYSVALHGVFDSLTRESERGGVYFSRGHSSARLRKISLRGIDGRYAFGCWPGRIQPPDSFAFHEITYVAANRALLSVSTAHQSGYIGRWNFFKRASRRRAADVIYTKYTMRWMAAFVDEPPIFILVCPASLRSRFRKGFRNAVSRNSRTNDKSTNCNTLRA